MLSVLLFWFGLGLATTALSLEAKNYGLGLGLVDEAFALVSCTCGLVNIPGVYAMSLKIAGVHTSPRNGRHRPPSPVDEAPKSKSSR